jgi:hypothetical protein
MMLSKVVLVISYRDGDAASLEPERQRRGSFQDKKITKKIVQESRNANGCCLHRTDTNIANLINNLL